MKMKNILKYLLIFGGVISITQCKTPEVQLKPVETNTLAADQTWYLLDDEGQPVKGIGEQNIFLKTAENFHHISGFSGCNSYTSTVSKGEQGNIQLGPIAATRRACPDSKIETNYFNLLNKVSQYEIIDNELFLKQGNLVLLKFRLKNT